MKIRESDGALAESGETMKIESVKKSRLTEVDYANLGFGDYFSDHMGIRRRATVSSSASGSSSGLVPGAVGGRPAVSPYDNLSIAQSLDESYSIDLEFSTASGATSTNTSRASSRCMDETASPPVQLRYGNIY